MRVVEQGRCPIHQHNPSVILNSCYDISDPNCGAAYRAAEDDTFLGYPDGCGEPNPDIAPVAPTVQPVCM